MVKVVVIMVVVLIVVMLAVVANMRYAFLLALLGGESKESIKTVNF